MPDALARVLLLDDVERDHLFRLVAARPRPHGRRRDERVPERLRHLLVALQVPAFIEGRAFDVLASSPLAVALSPCLRPGENRLRSLLLDPEEQGLPHRLG
ncbi:MmyB family transcriptional regulator [Lipingzhangella halophila]|uniref:MmyB family transcriptional regulator n=1 Tax=Lipingzhangella halophila TaxID=1783352 RepID=UPI0035E45B69